MTEWNDLDNPELKKLLRQHLARGLIFLFALVAIILILALIFEPQLRTLAHWLTDQFGILGIAILVFCSDLFISPIPPDAALFFVGKSDLHQSWFLYVPLLGLVSTLAGVCGWLIGQRLKHLKIVNKFLASLGDEYHDAIKRFGFWMVVLGALTPLPFSLTCWLAGIFKLPLQSFVVAALFRVPRFVIYYWAIFYSAEIGGLLRGLFSF